MKKVSLLIALLLASFAMNAQNSTNHPQRLKVGVVLGGGGAKGASHIGVLKYIEDMGIPEADIFLREFIPAYARTLDEL